LGAEEKDKEKSGPSLQNPQGKATPEVFSRHTINFVAKGVPPAKVLQVLKQKVSRSLRGRKSSPNGQLRLPFASEVKESPSFWQRRFYDFNVWSEKKVREKLNYMHKNPVERKLVAHPKDWPWSSWSHYAKGERGLIAIDSLRERTNPGENPHP
jgi:hypothetical protein